MKVSEAGNIAGYAYHHGEASAIDAMVGMAQDWSNNAPLFDGHGNFGSRKVPEAAAARYIFVTLSKNFSTYFMDTDIAPKSPNDENPEPMFYLPTIPWVLVNGVRGIAVGFATNILPRSPKDLARAVKNYLNGKAIGELKPSFPDFRGTVENVGGNSWKIRGTVTETGAFGFRITEVPYGTDRASMVETLIELCDSGKINDFDDDCNDAGFDFKIKVSKAQKEEILKQGALKVFKLETQVTENLTTVDHTGKLRIFKSADEIVKYFVDYRITKFEESINRDISKISNKISQLQMKRLFIQSILAKKIDLTKVSKSELISWIHVNISREEFAEGFVNIPIYQLTADNVKKLEGDILESQQSLERVREETPKSRYISKLK